MSEHDATSAQPSTPDDIAATTGQVGQPAGDADDHGSGLASASTEDQVAETAAESGGQGEPESTGDPRVDAALTRLDELDRLDVTEHAGVVDAIHRALQDTLAEEED